MQRDLDATSNNEKFDLMLDFDIGEAGEKLE